MDSIKEYSKEKDPSYTAYLLSQEYKNLVTKVASAQLLEKYVQSISAIEGDSTFIKPNNPKTLFTALYNKLTANDVLIDYNLYGKNLLTFVLTKDSISLHKLAISDSIVSHIKRLKTSMKESNPHKFHTNGKFLFNQLIAPIYPLVNKKENWIIIPESSFGSIPFEALPLPTTDSVTDFRFINYTIKHHSITYALTAHSIVNRSTKKGKSILGFSPSFNSEDQLSALPFSTTLLRNLEENYKGRFYFDKQVTKKALFQPNVNPQILQLATHFKLNVCP